MTSNQTGNRITKTNKTIDMTDIIRPRPAKSSRKRTADEMDSSDEEPNANNGSESDNDPLVSPLVEMLKRKRGGGHLITMGDMENFPLQLQRDDHDVEMLWFSSPLLPAACPWVWWSCAQRFSNLSSNSVILSCSFASTSGSHTVVTGNETYPRILCSFPQKYYIDSRANQIIRITNLSGIPIARAVLSVHLDGICCEYKWHQMISLVIRTRKLSLKFLLSQIHADRINFLVL